MKSYASVSLKYFCSLKNSIILIAIIEPSDSFCWLGFIAHQLIILCQFNNYIQYWHISSQLF